MSDFQENQGQVEQTQRDVPPYKPYLELDPVLHGVNSVEFPIYKGASAIMNLSTNAVAPTATQINFNVVVPSLSSIVSRRAKIYYDATVTATSNITLAAPAAAGGVTVKMFGGSFVWGKNMGLGTFPLQSQIAVANIKLNSYPVATNVAEMVDVLERTIDKEQLNKYIEQSAMGALDCFQNYNWGFTGVSTDSANNATPALGGNALAGNAQDSNVLNDAKSLSFLQEDAQGRSSFVVTINDGAIVGGAVTPTVIPAGQTTGTAIATINIKGWEELIIPPFLFGNPKQNSSGMWGLNTMTFTLTMNSTICRMVRVAPSAVTGFQYSCALNNTGNAAGTATKPVFALTGFGTDTHLDLDVYTPPLTMALPARNVNSYSTFQIVRANLPSLTNGSTSSPINLNVIPMNAIPHRQLLCVRKRYESRDYTDSNSFLPITKYQCNLGGQSALCSTYSQYDLFRRSKMSGYNGSWNQWSGYAMQGSTQVPTSGSVLCLRFGLDIPISDSFLCAGSSGQYTLQNQIQYVNNTGADIADSAYEVYQLLIYDNLFINELSTSTALGNSGFIDKSTVEKVSGEEPRQSEDNEPHFFGGKHTQYRHNKGHNSPLNVGASKYYAQGKSYGGSDGGSRLSHRFKK
jgi:hypothetical protein